MANNRVTAAEYDALAARGLVPAGALPAKGRVRHESGRMNKLESAYAQQLDLFKTAGAVAGYWFEAVKLRLADKTFYTPDFLVMLADGLLEFVEVKGHWEDDARCKWKIAAELFPVFQFVAVKKVKGRWVEERLR